MLHILTSASTLWHGDASTYLLECNKFFFFFGLVSDVYNLIALFTKILTFEFYWQGSVGEVILKKSTSVEEIKNASSRAGSRTENQANVSYTDATSSSHEESVQVLLGILAQVLSIYVCVCVF